MGGGSSSFPLDIVRLIALGPFILEWSCLDSLNCLTHNNNGLRSGIRRACEQAWGRKQRRRKMKLGCRISSKCGGATAPLYNKIYKKIQKRSRPQFILFALRQQQRQQWNHLVFNFRLIIILLRKRLLNEFTLLGFVSLYQSKVYLALSATWWWC